MPDSTYEKAVAFTVDKHITGLRKLVADHKLSEDDHDLIGMVLCKNIGHLIELSDFGWETLKFIVEDSRKVHYVR